jgi:membrane protein DedA with SNARE-associated domain
MIELLLIALATLISEDLTCIAAGVLVAQGKLSFLAATAACLVGILGGDLLLFLAGRVAGRRALRFSFVSRLLPPEKIDRASGWLRRRGMAVVLFSRFTPGLRLATYFSAGLLKTRMVSFAMYFLIASLLWTPLLVGGTVILGAPVSTSLLERGTNGGVVFLIVVGIAAVVHMLIRRGLRFSTRRRAVGFLKRKVRWEFWPPWAAYLPLIPYIAWLALRHRSLTVFTAANPGIQAGGFVGESKVKILEPLSAEPGIVPAFQFLPASLPPYAAEQAAREFMRRNHLVFPVVLKPDVGERGAGVAVIRSFEALREYFAGKSARPVLLQEYVGGLEFGVFYYRFPGQERGRILSITQKLFPALTGDGVRTIEELILADSRAVCLAKAYLQSVRRLAADVPAKEETVPLAEIGSHCRGSIFLDGLHLLTEDLTGAVDRISRRLPGFYFGRFDVRTQSAEALRRGEFKVLELNGVTSEATHIYDPAVSLWDAYAALFKQWRIAFEIGAGNRACGVKPAPLGELLGLIWERFRSHPARIQAPAGVAVELG